MLPRRRAVAGIHSGPARSPRAPARTSSPGSGAVLWGHSPHGPSQSPSASPPRPQEALPHRRCSHGWAPGGEASISVSPFVSCDCTPVQTSTKSASLLKCITTFTLGKRFYSSEKKQHVLSRIHTLSAAPRPGHSSQSRNLAWPSRPTAPPHLLLPNQTNPLSTLLGRY